MSKATLTLDAIDALLDELCVHQQRRVLEHARRLNGRVTADDILNPIDVPELSSSPGWNYEDGVLAGYRAAHAALRAAAADDAPHDVVGDVVGDVVDDR